MQRAIFLDRDGTINEDRAGYVKSWAEFRFLPGTLEALSCLAKLPHTIVVVTNQSAVGRGLVTVEVLERLHGRMRAEVAAYGGRIDAVYFCPHTPEDDCACRKPKPGLLYTAAAELGLSFRGSWLVGNATSDVEAGLAVGLRVILIGLNVTPIHDIQVCCDLREAAKVIVETERVARSMLVRNGRIPV